MASPWATDHHGNWHHVFISKTFPGLRVQALSTGDPRWLLGAGAVASPEASSLGHPWPRAQDKPLVEKLPRLEEEGAAQTLLPETKLGFLAGPQTPSYSGASSAGAQADSTAAALLQKHGKG